MMNSMNKRLRELEEQLAASQAREQQLREALSRIPEVEWWEDARKIVAEALALPQDTSALQDIVAKAGEVMREWCFAIGHSASIDDSIRALPAISLEDLK